MSGTVTIVLFTGVLSQAVASPTQAASGTEAFSGSALQRASSPTQFSSGGGTFSGSSSQTVAQVTQSEIGSETFGGASAQGVAPLTQTGVGTKTDNFIGGSTQTVAPLTQVSLGFTQVDAAFFGASFQTVSSPTQSDIGSKTFSGSASQAVVWPMHSGSGGSTFSGSATQNISSPTHNSIGKVNLGVGLYGMGLLVGYARVTQVPPPASCTELQVHVTIDCTTTDCGVCHWLNMLPPWIPRDRAHISMFLGPAGQALFPDGCTCNKPFEPHLEPSLEHPFGHRIPCPPKQFRWGHEFQFGDLVLDVTTSSGDPFSPYSVTWTMFRVLPGGSLVQAGPTQVGVQQKVGLFYATGTAGENGQPGDWVIRWAYARSFGIPEVTVDESFRVVDAVLDPVPGDKTCRVPQFGWE